MRLRRSLYPTDPSSSLAPITAILSGLKILSYFLMDAMNSSMGMAGKVVICMVPREPSSMETLATVLLSAASTMLMKSYSPKVACCESTLTPRVSSSWLTCLILSGLSLTVFHPSSVSFDNRM